MKNILNVRWNAKAEETCVLNLDAGFSPFNDTKGLFFLKSKADKFPGGEPLFQILANPDTANYSKDLIITHRFNSVDDLVSVIIATDAARYAGFKNITLVFPYFPAARQDRLCNEGESLTVKVFANMINACGFEDVLILTPHSEVTPALVNNCTLIDDLQFAKATVESFLSGIPNTTEVNVVCPDAGAGKRTAKIAAFLAKEYPRTKFNLIKCDKHRDLATGKLLSFNVQADDLGGHPSIIFDDIVSMGGTFIGLGNILKEKNSGPLALSVSHADCAAGLVKMVEFFDRVFVTNSRQNWAIEGVNNLTCFEIKL